MQIGKVYFEDKERKKKLKIITFFSGIISLLCGAWACMCVPCCCSAFGWP